MENFPPRMHHFTKQWSSLLECLIWPNWKFPSYNASFYHMVNFPPRMTHLTKLKISLLECLIWPKNSLLKCIIWQNANFPPWMPHLSQFENFPPWMPQEICLIEPKNSLPECLKKSVFVNQTFLSLNASNLKFLLTFCFIKS